MRFYPHWARARGRIDTPDGPQSLSTLGWSDESPEAAQDLARRRLAELSERLRTGFPPKGEYDYGGERPPPEPVLERVCDDSGQVVAVITRNGYGARVLNTDRALFIDVDFGPPQRSSGFFRSLFQKPPSPEQAALQRVEQAAQAYPGWAIRVYRTFAGLRLVLLNESLSGFEQHQLDVLDEFGSDPLYRRLCLAQRCFRARLTPKPWRLGLPPPPTRFPFSSAEERTRFDAWLQKYEQVSAGYAACRPLSTLGLGHTSPTVRAIVAAHDAVAVQDAGELA